MPNFLAMSFEGELAPCFDLRCLTPGNTNTITKRLPDGWGIGFYPGGEPSASVLKEAAPPPGSIRSEIIKAWEHLEASLFLLHIRSATWGSISDANTQPFCRSYAGRDFLLAHSGSLALRLTPKGGPLFQPVGSTDSELIFCELLRWLSEKGAKGLGDVDPAELRAFLEELNALGSLTLAVTDGRDLLLYADATGESAVHLGKVQPPFEKLVISDADVEIDLTRRGAKSRKGIICASNPMEGASIEWTTLEPGGLLLARQGALVAEAKRLKHASPSPTPAPIEIYRGPIRPAKSEPSCFSVVHRTVYRYSEKPVERSTHLLRLEPAHDKLQTLLDHELTVSVSGHERAYQDVFGNQVRKIALDTPFTELVIEARSRVLLLDTDPLAYRPPRQRSKIPLVWMPWQWHMLQPFLLPPELPESQLRELSDYAMSFVERNDYDLLDTLLDLNATIFREYKYLQGSTTISTTPFEVYVSRRGVCQDFTNVFICLARLLGVPARYVCGYVYTGPKRPSLSEASHAWVQVYLPEIGWKGFDPTSGILTQTNHIRVAVGRSYVDATPTSGTIYVGGGGETLEVDVRVEPVDYAAGN